ncbi:hypothetical protein SISNIDRAFT_458689 [Sistotremastrum niveocremeum HHB9708]|uniref:Uncharacterized protein n=1 Tax=Sistotremastrum niveocremeum HHB9708 TaxID=1314777 RepID=A0A164QAP2_9AGAM|nr:hypothetical protein SISNIDRAFT_458689 [Sistotremastrum niveocremeum HHB9708]
MPVSTPTRSSTRTLVKSSVASTPDKNKNSTPKKSTPKKVTKRKTSPRSDEDDEDDKTYEASLEEEVDNEGGNEGQDESVEEIDSDNLDEDENFREGKKRKRVVAGRGRGTPKSTPKKKRKVEDQEDDDDDENVMIVGRVVQAPTTGKVPPGQISKNTLGFLENLKDPKCNDQPVYRQAEQEFKDFITEFTDSLIAADPQLPALPPKDVIHRIYRDVRFSNDKTPYKTGFSASFSRSGRKGIFAGFKPGGSLLAAGTWCPAKNELSCIRHNILHSRTLRERLRSTISDPSFIQYFGPPTKHPKGERQSIFGAEDELKNAPKIEGVTKDHKDIDLLKLRSLAVSCRFTDSEVLAPTFKDDICKIVTILRPFVHW